MSRVALDGQRNVEYEYYLKSLYGGDNGDSRRALMRNLRTAMKDELTPRQLYMMKLYFVDGLKMHCIAEELGINKSTVSRTLTRGKARLRKCLKYGAAGLLENKCPDGE